MVRKGKESNGFGQKRPQKEKKSAFWVYACPIDPENFKTRKTTSKGLRGKK